MIQDLPQDIQQHILAFIPLWQRLGMAGPPIPPARPLEYYKQMRHRPHFKSLRWERPDIFIYDRSRNVFKWTLILDYRDHYHENHMIDYYRIECQHRSKSFPEDELKTIHRTGFYLEDCPSLAEFVRAYVATFHRWNLPARPVLKIELKVKRLYEFCPPTRQVCANVLCEYMIGLSRQIEDMIK